MIFDSHSGWSNCTNFNELHELRSVKKIFIPLQLIDFKSSLHFFQSINQRNVVTSRLWDQPGTRNQEPGTRNTEHGTRNTEPIN